MINPTVWTSGPVTVTASGDVSTVVTWELVDPDTATLVASGGVDSAAGTQVVFTPAGAAPDVYTVVLRDVDGTELHRETSALAVVSTVPPDVPDGITLQWIDAWGAVRFTAAGMGDNQTVRMIGPGKVLIPIRGYETADWHAGTDVGYGYAFEMPLGVLVSFTIADVSAVTWQGAPFVSITTPKNRAWLRDLHNPLLSMEVTVSSTGTESRLARQTVHRISGRPRPIVRWDVRDGRAGTITLRVENTPSDFWVETFRDRLDTLLDTGRPLLITMCHTKGFPPCYMAVGDYRLTRVGLKALWSCELDYLEVDNPTMVDILIPAEVTYEQAQQLPPNASYADWAAVRYLDVATRTSV